MDKIIKVGFCVAYDWVLLQRSLPLIYPHADTICLSIDKNSQTWGGKKYFIDRKAFQKFVKAIDTKNKIDVYEDDFSLPKLSAMENDTRQRTLMAQRMGEGGWHIQIDSDEYFLNFGSCVSKLLSINPCPTGVEKPISVCAFLIPLIKKLPTGYLHVNFRNRLPETLTFATTRPVYERARLSSHFNIFVPEYVVHETWARSDDELWLKMNNWGHASDELADEMARLSYYNFWKVWDDFNYKYVTNFHPAIPQTWPALQFTRAQSVEEFLQKFRSTDLPLSNFQLWLKNNRQVSRIKFYSKKLLASFKRHNSLSN